MAYLSEYLLDAAWIDLKDRVDKIDVPLALWKSPQNPAAPFLVAFEAYNDSREQLYDKATGRKVRSFSVRELEQWSASLAEQQALVGKLEAAYPQRGASKIVQKKVVEDEHVSAALPWWYWPLRVGAGIGGGYFLYKVLRPTEGSSQPALAGLGAATNAEGMTYSEWRAAAAVGGGKRPENDPLDAADRRALKKAWKEGEDPSDWRKYFSDRSYAREMERVK